MTRIEVHQRLAERLRSAATGPGVTSASLREAIVQRVASDGPAPRRPYAELVDVIAVAAYRVTDQQVELVRREVGSDKAAFEIIATASVGAGLRRWDRAVEVIAGASRATG